MMVSARVVFVCIYPTLSSGFGEIIARAWYIFRMTELQRLAVGASFSSSSSSSFFLSSLVELIPISYSA